MKEVDFLKGQMKKEINIILAIFQLKEIYAKVLCYYKNENFHYDDFIVIKKYKFF